MKRIKTHFFNIGLKVKTRQDGYRAKAELRSEINDWLYRHNLLQSVKNVVYSCLNKGGALYMVAILVYLAPVDIENPQTL